VDDSDKTEIGTLLEILSEGGKRTSELPFKVHPSRVDVEVSLSRKAISESRLISCSYINAANVLSDREIEPISLESNDSIWYLRGYCRCKQQVRVFRLDRMRDISLSTEEMVRSSYPESDLTSIYSASESDTDVVFDIDPAGFGLLADYKPDYPAVGGKTLRVTIPIGDISTLGRMVSKYSGHVRVVSPEAARRVVFDYANRALGITPTQEKVE
jgi:proteasome accessory factor C